MATIRTTCTCCERDLALHERNLSIDLSMEAGSSYMFQCPHSGILNFKKVPNTQTLDMLLAAGVEIGEVSI